MSVLKERQKTILSATIREYVRTARPIASQELSRHLKEDISSATIRNEMLALDELGLLEQPHTSAGRVPTDKGYRFFVDNLPVDGFLQERDEETLREIFSIRDAEDFIREFSKTVSAISRTFTAAGMFEEDIFYETGFSRIMEEPEFYDPDNGRMFGRLLDILGEKLRDIAQDTLEKEERIFIGRENPLKEAAECSMIFSPWRHPEGFSGFITLIGPKRTNYPRHKALVRSIKKIQGQSD